MKSPYVKLDVERYDELIEIEKSYDFKVSALAENYLVISGGFNNRIVINNPTEQQKIICTEIKKAALDNIELKIKLNIEEGRIMNLKRILGLTLMVLVTSLALIIHLLLEL